MLILRPQSAARADTAWRRALVDDPESVKLVGVCLSDRPAEWYKEWREVLGTEPAAAAVITTPELAGDDDPDSVELKTVSTPSNLTGIGVKTTPYLNRWDDAVAVVDPLTVLCQYADTQEVYQFLHVLLARLRGSGQAQVYADPVVDDERSIELLKSLFDAVVEYDPEGEHNGDWNARRRQS
ncbi:hypothetical protein GCM10008995_14270 [Halobellus salinus]|uniref:Uncharacterized protein n=1 Tax=Halobellus salinus TaxID=931585 RepID=A0A830E9Z4_9EURY|nr:hypothetical protein GCM10008995_14270 [Halobellus salinus]